jgi:hypothetical protein
MLYDGSTFYSQIGKMAIPVVAIIFTDKIKYSSIYVIGYTIFSQNTILAVLIEASGSKKCSHF